MRRMHRWLGILLLLPLIAWSTTAVVFIGKPGYDQAYSSLSVRSYPIERRVQVIPEPDWKEFRYLRTRLGDHLIVHDGSDWEHYDPHSGEYRRPPSPQEVELLVADAMKTNPERYGMITDVDGYVVTTDTGVTISLDWQSLSLNQRGRDTKVISLLYRVHGMEWTGIELIDNVIGYLGVGLVVLSTVFGFRLFFR